MDKKSNYNFSKRNWQARLQGPRQANQFYIVIQLFNMMNICVMQYLQLRACKSNAILAGICDRSIDNNSPQKKNTKYRCLVTLKTFCKPTLDFRSESKNIKFNIFQFFRWARPV